MKYTCIATFEATLDIEVDIQHGHAYLKRAIWHGTDITEAINNHPDLLKDIEESIWQRWYADTQTS